VRNAENVFKVRGQRSKSHVYKYVNVVTCNNGGGGIHFDGVASRLTCLENVDSHSVIDFIYKLMWTTNFSDQLR